MKLIMKLYKLEFIFITLCLTLSLYSAFITYKFITAKDNLLLISIDRGQPRIIKYEEALIYLEESKKAFLSHFVSLFYNFTDQNYDRNISKSTDLMSEAQFHKIKTALFKNSKMVKTNKILQSAVITKMKLLTENIAELHIDIQTVNKQKIENITLKSKIEVRKIKRNSINPWGIEVVNVQEEVL